MIQLCLLLSTLVLVIEDCNGPCNKVITPLFLDLLPTCVNLVIIVIGFLFLRQNITQERCLKFPPDICNLLPVLWGLVSTALVVLMTNLVFVFLWLFLIYTILSSAEHNVVSGHPCFWVSTSSLSTNSPYMI